MLTDAQYRTVWERQIAAEIRSLYFADLASKYARQKQFVTFLTFFLSSGAAATLVGKRPTWIAILLLVLVAMLSAYSIAFGMDRKVTTMSKLRGDWSTLATDMRACGRTPPQENTDAGLSELLLRDLDASKIAATEAPNDQKRMTRWTHHVFVDHGFQVSLPAASLREQGSNG